ncbi:MAG: hypothetical protein QGF90_13785 [Gammaproteobacteria bacterium]|nr:hypothetical protein [Gammaproteobacteria bacterium]
MRSKLIYVIFAIGILMAAILLAIILAEPVIAAGGAAHPNFPGMQVGGDGAARLQHIGMLGFAFHCLLLTQIVLLSMLGISERYRTLELGCYMGGCLGLMLVIAWGMFSNHLQYLDTGTTGYFMGFPTATAWQLYGTWLGAIPLVIIYSVGFGKFIYTAEDEEKYNALLAEKASQSERTTSE